MCGLNCYDESIFQTSSKNTQNWHSRNDESFQKDLWTLDSPTLCPTLRLMSASEATSKRYYRVSEFLLNSTVCNIEPNIKVYINQRYFESERERERVIKKEFICYCFPFAWWIRDAVSICLLKYVTNVVENLIYSKQQLQQHYCMKNEMIYFGFPL